MFAAFVTLRQLQEMRWYLREASILTAGDPDVISIATKKRQAIERYEVHAIGDQREEYPQVLTEVTVTHEVWGTDISEAAIRRSIELSATKYCPVNAMLSAGATTVHHRYVIHSTGERPYDAADEVIATGPYQRPEVVPGG